MLALFVVVIGFGFKDAGVFVTDYTVKEEEKSVQSFEDGEKVVLIKENKDSYQVNKDGTSYLIPKNVMIRTTRGTNEYESISDTKVYAEASCDSEVIDTIKAGTVVTLNKTHNNFGFFTYASNKKSGFIEFSSLKRIEKQNITYGYATDDKVVKNDGKYLALIKNESVSIVDYKDGKYKVSDKKGNIFIVGKSLINLYETSEEASRGTSRSVSENITNVVTKAYSLIGKPYVYGSAGPNSFDCSGFTYSIYKNVLGIVLPRSSRYQVSAGIKISKSELRPGDLVFFNTVGSNISHVGLYIGEGNMIHASSGKGRVRIDTILSGWYSGRYVTARRIVK
ncbi:NlpC/P60 family protein [Soehngenia saccharolytica]|nr:NlpC/P60 family protein [Soehngenia saccharolytica]